MLEAALPERIDLRRLPSGGQRFRGRLDAAAMRRLRERLLTPSGEVTAEFDILLDQGGRAVVRGTVGARIGMRCQRCLEEVALTLEEPFHLVVVESESAAEVLSRQDDAAVAPGGELDVVRMLEDELLLALPAVPMHEGEERCAGRSHHFGPPGEKAPERENPFAVLARLKDGGREQD